MSEPSTVTYSVKELIARIEGKIDVVLLQMNHKADAHEVEQLRERVVVLETAESNRATLSAWQRFWVGTVGIGVIGAIGTLVWLATSH